MVRWNYKLYVEVPTEKKSNLISTPTAVHRRSSVPGCLRSHCNGMGNYTLRLPNTSTSSYILYSYHHNKSRCLFSAPRRSHPHRHPLHLLDSEIRYPNFRCCMRSHCNGMSNCTQQPIAATGKGSIARGGTGYTIIYKWISFVHPTLVRSYQLLTLQRYVKDDFFLLYNQDSSYYILWPSRVTILVGPIESQMPEMVLVLDYRPSHLLKSRW